MSAYKTPGPSRARPKPPGAPVKDKSTAVRKLGTLPSLQHRAVLHPPMTMIVKILRVLSALGYPKVVQPSAFRALAGTDLQQMFSFLLGIMVGPNNGKDVVTYLSESLDMLGCPVTTLKMSSLKMLSVPHVFPSTITAMCWLACYVEDFMGLRTDRFLQQDFGDDDPIEQIMNAMIVITGQNETLDKKGKRLAALEMKLEKLTPLVTALQFSVGHFETVLALQQQLKEAIEVVGQLTTGNEARKKDLAELEQANEADAKLIEELTAKVTEIDARVERLKLTSGSKNGGGGCSTNAKAGSDKDSTEAA